MVSIFLFIIIIQIFTGTAVPQVLQITLYSGGNDLVSGPDVIGSVNAVPVEVWNGWSGIIEGSIWIWDAYQVSNQSAQQTCNFTRSFFIDGTPISALLYLAVDDVFSLNINNQPTKFSTTYYEGGSVFVYDITSYVAPFKNNLQFTVTNFIGLAGLLYKLVVKYKTLVDSGFL
jgi:hypothetical protein